MDFPDTIEGFGYRFNEEGRLRNIETGEPFKFSVKEDDQNYNQKHYEALGEVLTHHIYDLLEKDCGLQRLPIPLNPRDDEPHTFIFCSQNYQSADKLLLLIHGSGVVRAGQWARRLIINDCLKSGTQIPFIERAHQEGYGVIVMNTNDNTMAVSGKKLVIKGSENPEAHGRYVWKNYLRKCQASRVAIVAHSFGGIVLTKLCETLDKEFFERVFAFAMTDSVHFRIPNAKLIEIGRNWVTSSSPLDTPVGRSVKDIPCVSAGCKEHEMTSWSSFESIFRFFSERLAAVNSAHDISTDEDSEPIHPTTDKKMKTDNEDGDHHTDIHQSTTIDRATDGVQSASVDHSTDGVQSASVDRATDGVQSASVDHSMDGVKSASVDRATDGVKSASIDHSTDGVQSASVDRATDGVQSASVDHYMDGVKSASVDRATDGVQSASVDCATDGIQSASVDRATDGVQSASVDRATCGIQRASVDHATDGVQNASVDRATDGVQSASVDHSMDGVQSASVDHSTDGHQSTSGDLASNSQQPMDRDHTHEDDGVPDTSDNEPPLERDSSMSSVNTVD